jgi:hypothetical protein
VLLVAASGCVAETGVGYHAAVVAPAPVVTATVEAPAPAPVVVEAAPAAEVVVEEPDLVEVEPGIRVVYDYDEPVFFSDGFYWRLSGGTWYRSSVHTGGWIVYNDVPSRIRGIRNPHTYAHYRPAGYTPRVREHRTPVVNGGHRVEPAHGTPVVNGAHHPAGTPVVNGNAHPAGTPVVNGGGYHPAGTPVVNGNAHPAGTPVVNGAKGAPAQTYHPPAKKDDKKDKKK